METLISLDWMMTAGLRVFFTKLPASYAHKPLQLTSCTSAERCGLNFVGAPVKYACMDPGTCHIHKHRESPADYSRISFK